MERSSRAATSAFCSRRFSRFSVLQSREQPCGGSKITFALSNGYVSAEQRPFFPDHAASRVSLSYNQLRSCEVGRNLKPRITCECYTACYHVVHGTLLSAHSLKRAARCPVNFGPYDLSGISVFSSHFQRVNLEPFHLCGTGSLCFTAQPKSRACGCPHPPCRHGHQLRPGLELKLAHADQVL